MLRNVLVMATSGLVLFSKEFLHAIPQPRLIGSLLTAILEFSAKTTGAPVSYMEFTNVAVTIVVNESAKVFCAIFFDVADGPKFGAFLAKEILAAFVDEYAGDLGNIGHNLRDFHGFHYKISEVIRESVKPILSTCTTIPTLIFMNRLSTVQQQRGIQKAILVTDDAVTYATVEVDQLGVLVNMQSLRTLAADTSTKVDELWSHRWRSGVCRRQCTFNYNSRCKELKHPSPSD
ncbi:hypothetical protein AeRB84_016747 [Aphanomyces euteiches]|nr:hypothetical protein AeRB84_016747 [Aphanomyces euteiches]